jgi:Bacterial Ig-like domain (group 3)/FG-GAP-like repeat
MHLRINLLYILACLTVMAAPGAAQQQLVPPPPIPVTSPVVTINNSAGDQFRPRVDNDLMSYTNTADLAIHYYRFSTGVDSAIPLGPGTGDSRNEILGNKICFTRADSGDQIAIFDVQAGSVSEIDPQSGAQRYFCAMGGTSITFQDTVTGTPAVYDLSVNPPTRVDLTKPLASDPLLNPDISPDGSYIALNDQSGPSGSRDIWEAVLQSPSTWNVFQVTATPDDEANQATDGSWIVYDGLRSSSSWGREIYYQPVGPPFGAETELVLAGDQSAPRIRQGVIAFSSIAPGATNGDIFVYDIGHNVLYQVTATPSVDEAVADVSVLSNGDIRVVWTQGPVGARDIYATTFTPGPQVATPVPTINQPLVPDHAVPGSGPFSLQVNGAEFAAGATVLWNGSPRPTTFNSQSQLQADISAADVAHAGTTIVTVKNPLSGVPASNPGYFVISTTHNDLSTWSRTDYSAGSQPERQATGDFNGDGKLDMVSIDPNNDAVLVALGNGNGTFQAAVSYPTNRNPSFVAAADFNGDGKLDLVTADLAGNGVSLLLGNGDGTFNAPSFWPAGNGPFWLAIGDFNGDGALDLAVTDRNDSTIGVLIQNVSNNQGNGTFQPPVFYPTGDSPSGIVVGDFDGNGTLDLAVANFGNFSGHTVSILFGDGTGGFLPKVDSDTSGAPQAIVAADFNNDGILDLATANGCGASSPCGSPANVSVLLGNGDGSFQPHVDYTTGSSSNTLTAGNFRSAAAIDLAVTNLNSGNITFLMGQGDGTFPSQTVVSTNSAPVGITAGDFNGDGQLDLVVGGDSPAAMTVMLRSSSGVVTTTSSLVSSKNPVTKGQVVTLTATVSGASPTGNVAFKDGTKTLSTLPLVSGQASFAVAFATAVTHSLTSVYAGDSNNSGSKSPILQEHVVTSLPVVSLTKVTSSGSPVPLGQSVTFTVTVTSAFGPIPDGELVTFFDGTSILGRSSLAGGVATYTTSALTTKSHVIKATYAGDATFKTSSGTVTESVGGYSTTTTLGSGLNPSNYGQPVTLTANVTSSGAASPTGTVTFKNKGTLLGTKALDANGNATLTTSTLPVAADSLAATYNGDAFNQKSTGALVQTVNQAALSLSLSSKSNPSVFGRPARFTATLTSSGGLPGGTVTFSFGATTLGRGQVNPSGVATFSVTTLPKGVNPVVATYAGNASYSPATATVVQNVSNPPIPGVGSLVFIGDSQTANYFYQPALTLTATYNQFTAGYPSKQVLYILNQATTDVDPLYLPGVTNIAVVWAGTVDCYNNNYSRSIWTQLSALGVGRQNIGFKTIIFTLPSLIKSDACRNAVNADIIANWHNGYDAIVRLDLAPNIGANGDYANKTYFSPDGIHVLQSAQAAYISPIASTAINTLGP